ncbi:S-methyl-5'-thioadenosine phosphorylase [Aquisalimonas lutea]|uniref:S-methyl-5'-thioadenosine phosphorylase n=1 Tax=Aquisalimonas lutea TaxID=1327750 RepID=UPI0025B5B144|nr:S-methyl-5'-thioadenosine phosphorylase [Aquisalimonas lutea]MDN3519405.1 S-methyl-5'-thioadenosine phosphorylase [Aquisalimonas lutea]
MDSVLGIVGGSGLYDLAGLDNARWEYVESPWGEPSDAILFADLHGLPIRFLPRHGRGHRLGPRDINYRANIDALKRAGATDLVSFSACGSLAEQYPPGHFVLVDQFIDRTQGRQSSFFGAGCVAHVSMADPVSPILAEILRTAAADEAIQAASTGTYLVIDGPQFSSRAEARLYRAWGCDVIGMTNMPEAKLAREAELAYATVAMVTDFDCWHDAHDAVDVAGVLAVMQDNTEKARRLIERLGRTFPRTHPACPEADHALDGAIVTAQTHRDADLMRKLDAVAGRVLGAEED